jgi:hypothetical protein
LNIFNEAGELVWSSARKSLAGANLSGAVLRGGIFNEVDARGVILRNAKMEGSIWTCCKLDDADAIGAEAGGCRFNFCSMVGSNWNASKLVAASFIGSDLTKASFYLSDIRFIDFEEAASTKGTKFDKLDIDKILAEPPEAGHSSLDPVQNVDSLVSPEDALAMERLDEEIHEAQKRREEARDSNVFLQGFPYAQRESVRAFMKSRGLWREPKGKLIRR